MTVAFPPRALCLSHGRLLQGLELCLGVGCGSSRQRRLHGRDAPGPAKAHAKKEGQGSEQVDEEDAGGWRHEEHQRGKEGGRANAMQRRPNVYQEGGHPGRHGTAEERLEVIAVEVVEPRGQSLRLCGSGRLLGRGAIVGATVSRHIRRHCLSDCMYCRQPSIRASEH
ncbi:uncharacterized protein TrAtP1_002082 [Trichoderma atroviride]|uniref:uncharacterized protein n=1 Tax=Hypocrea atroviridis TaxID=63577 RepID=UPI00332FC876|nr:hypothetical protein TrAtP1_002082 [Trichoderma atroviride]